MAEAFWGFLAGSAVIPIGLLVLVALAVAFGIWNWYTGVPLKAGSIFVEEWLTARLTRIFVSVGGGETPLALPRSVDPDVATEMRPEENSPAAPAQ